MAARENHSDQFESTVRSGYGNLNELRSAQYRRESGTLPLLWMPQTSLLSLTQGGFYTGDASPVQEVTDAGSDECVEARGCNANDQLPGDDDLEATDAAIPDPSAPRSASRHNQYVTDDPEEIPHSPESRPPSTPLRPITEGAERITYSTGQLMRFRNAITLAETVTSAEMPGTPTHHGGIRVGRRTTLSALCVASTNRPVGSPPTPPIAGPSSYARAPTPPTPSDRTISPQAEALRDIAERAGPVSASARQMASQFRSPVLPEPLVVPTASGRLDAEQQIERRVFECRIRGRLALQRQLYQQETFVVPLGREQNNDNSITYSLNHTGQDIMRFNWAQPSIHPLEQSGNWDGFTINISVAGLLGSEWLDAIVHFEIATAAETGFITHDQAEDIWLAWVGDGGERMDYACDDEMLRSDDSDMGDDDWMFGPSTPRCIRVVR
jgi:hypothetical protein